MTTEMLPAPPALICVDMTPVNDIDMDMDMDIDMDSGTVWTGAPVPALDDDAAWAVLDAELQVWIDAG